MTDRVILAYSGGLDTSVAIPYLAERTGAEVVAVAVDVGQGGEDLEVIRKRALGCGAVEAEVVDAREEFAAPEEVRPLYLREPDAAINWTELGPGGMWPEAPS